LRDAEDCSLSTIQHGFDLLRRSDELIGLGVCDFLAALRLDRADESRQGIAGGAARSL